MLDKAMRSASFMLLWLVMATSCSAGKGNRASADTAATVDNPLTEATTFSADSAYSFVARQVSFGPRVPNTSPHVQAGDWLATRLRRYGAEVVVEQPIRLRAFDGTILNARNIMGRYNPDAKERLLLLAHWDSRPWADEDEDPARRHLPVDGANDGASGVGILLEIARQLSLEAPAKGVDILFVDAEDWGTSGDEESWALGTRYFAANPPVAGYSPTEAILLDMVGGKDAVFCREYFSQQAAPDLNDKIWGIASSLGYGNRFVNRLGGAITDDHVQLINAGIPAINIIEYHPGESGFNERWHTTADNMEGISAETLGSVGHTVMTYLRKYY